MNSFRLEITDKLLPIGNKKYRIKSLDDIKDQLNDTKNKLDEWYKKPMFEKYWRECDPFKNEKGLVAKIGNTFNVSNAWLKCYEILIYYDLLPVHLSHSEFVHFDNAAFPGSFIVSTHHLIKTQFSWFDKYRWYGSSLLDSNSENKEPLEDKYKLYANYPDNWLMNKNNNGDVLIEANQKDFCRQLGGKVDLYTSDLGFDVSSDYNNQELIQAPANTGQILSGLLTLRKGGCFITKQYTTFEPITLSVMYIAASFFKEFYVCKPYSSREANSETYLVGKGFLGGVYFDHPYIKELFGKISTLNKPTFEVPIFDAKHYPQQYIKQIIAASKKIFGDQINKINEDIKRVEQCIRNNYRGRPADNPVIIEFVQSIEKNIIKWYDTNKIIPITKSKVLKMNDLYRQQY
jgi:23S rRNA U2552 (ribose-2'-O)-methylase RlmE/FtsJ